MQKKRKCTFIGFYSVPVVNVGDIPISVPKELGRPVGEKAKYNAIQNRKQ